MSDVMAANPQHYSMGGFSYGTLCNATASPVPPSQMGVCELFNQVIFDYNDDGTADAMIETGTDGLGNLNCTIFSDPSYSQKRDVSTVKVGDVIYWTTQAADGRTWNHMGTVFATAAGHPNRS